MHQEPLEILEEDLEKLFHYKYKKTTSWDITWIMLKSSVAFLILYLGFFVLINIPAYRSKADYFWKTIVLGEEVTPNNQQTLGNLKTNTNPIPVETEPLAPNGQKLADFLREHVENNHLNIPIINVNAPVTWNSPEERILEDLKNGVAHYDGTALPGENGNVFISGHSSNYWWNKGLYNQVFALLDKVKQGDRIYLNYNNQPYVYTVEKIEVVKPDNIEVLNPTDHSVITLMTCTPVGTTLNRLIVQARQIYPRSTTTSTKKPTAPSQLPAIR